MYNLYNQLINVCHLYVLHSDFDCCEKMMKISTESYGYFQQIKMHYSIKSIN